MSDSLSKDYLLKDQEEKQAVATEPVPTEKAAVESNDTPTSETVPEPAVETNDTPTSETVPEPVDSSDSSDAPAAEENAAPTDDTEAPPAATEESEEIAEEEEKPEIKLETAPGDYRFPTTNQSRHCFTRYVEYHRCVAAKGEGAPECDKFAKYYRSLCPGEWVDKWNEQRENGTFPGPL
ncbi:cytochrome c oxidase, subunit VIb [Artemisia annua]|uniref:Cytochrome c oxidase, subunit VIb n=1 Tax=Artemisia annua TaxID=35608 RepID=A0A2U1N2V8_ARTAN|nr:cytochrome c oxidase, subunit VIb [Artemisia annua]